VDKTRGVGVGAAEDFVHDGQDGALVVLDVGKVRVAERILHEAVAGFELGGDDQEAVAVGLGLALPGLAVEGVEGVHAVERDHDRPAGIGGAAAVGLHVVLGQVEVVGLAGGGLGLVEELAVAGLLRYGAAGEAEQGNQYAQWRV